MTSKNDDKSLVVEEKYKVPNASGLLLDVKGPCSSRSGKKRKMERTSEETFEEKKACLPGDISKESVVKKTKEQGTQTHEFEKVEFKKKTRSLWSRLFKVPKSKTRKKSWVKSLFLVPKAKHGMKLRSVSKKTE